MAIIHYKLRLGSPYRVEDAPFVRVETRYLWNDAVHNEKSARDGISDSRVKLDIHSFCLVSEIRG